MLKNAASFVLASLGGFLNILGGVLATSQQMSAL